MTHYTASRKNTNNNDCSSEICKIIIKVIQRMKYSKAVDTVTWYKWAIDPERCNKSYWPSPLITLSTQAQLTTWQTCLTKEISFLTWVAGAPEKEEKKKKKKKQGSSTRKLRSMNCHTMSKWERAIWSARFQYLTLQWQLDPIMAEHFSKPPGEPPIRQTHPTHNDQP